MNIYSYQKASTVADVVAQLGEPGTFLLAGGTDLIAQMKTGSVKPAAIIDIKKIPEMCEIRVAADGGLHIGAAVAARTLAASDIIRQRHAGLHDAVQLIGSLQIQNRATLGGNICNASPSADAVPPVLVDAATARIIGPEGERSIPLEQLFAGPGRTTLGPGELLVSLYLPKPAPRSASAYQRFTPRREMDIAVVGAAVRLDVDADDRITAARIALASVAPTPIRAPAAELALIGVKISDAAFAAAAIAAQDDATPISDTRGSAEYRRDLIAVLVRRALAQCSARLASGQASDTTSGPAH